MVEVPECSEHGKEYIVHEDKQRPDYWVCRKCEGPKEIEEINDKKEILNKIEDTHSIDLHESDVLVWNVKECTSRESQKEMLKVLERSLPEVQHIIVGGLENLYKLNSEFEK